MQALSQLSYGPTMLRAGDHSDIDDAWEVVCAKKFARRICQRHRSTWRVPSQAVDAFARRRMIDRSVVYRDDGLIA
ncbi:hypothetical protein XaplCFBP3122_01130 [Xanthomonas arboricola pv. populi]|uniref:Uncharacterized protein n=1 Tax=Xanthomonas arboricola pv. populi TaxID=487823 RepID=A0A2S6Z9T4_9XANT|nr:hypothetical protein XaplCFBP3122_01130 [Xanthomonas arboricola pv. populi]